jgi:hypothetical protein
MITAPDTKIIHIATTAPHTFFITEQELLTHNAFPLVIGLSWLFGGGLEFLGISIGTAALGSYVGVQLYNAQKQKEQDCNLSIHCGPCGYPCPDPDDDDDKNKERKFNTITKTEFFEKVEEHYEYYKDKLYIKKGRSKLFGKRAKYIKWDHLHGDVEIYDKAGNHLGSVDPKTLQFYKPASPRNWIVL